MLGCAQVSLLLTLLPFSGVPLWHGVSWRGARASSVAKAVASFKATPRDYLYSPRQHVPSITPSCVCQARARCRVCWHARSTFVAVHRVMHKSVPPHSASQPPPVLPQQQGERVATESLEACPFPFRDENRNYSSLWAARAAPWYASSDASSGSLVRCRPKSPLPILVFAESNIWVWCSG